MFGVCALGPRHASPNTAKKDLTTHQPLTYSDYTHKSISFGEEPYGRTIQQSKEKEQQEQQEEQEEQEEQKHTREQQHCPDSSNDTVQIHSII